jgi:hypothetical protein
MTDSLGVQLDRIATAFGTGVETGAISKAAKVNITRVQTIASPTGGNDASTAADLLPGELQHIENLKAGAKSLYGLLAFSLNNLIAHLKNRGDVSHCTLDLMATANAARFSPSFAELARSQGVNLSAGNIYPPVTLLGSFSASGAGAGTYTDGGPVDTNLYGGANIEAEATAACSNVAITAVATDVDGASTNCTGTLNGATGTKVDLVAANGKKLVNTASVTITGGAAGNTFKIQTKTDRTPVE